jgi:protein phosphatase
MNKIAIISDIHGNTTALDAVFASIDKKGINKIFCLGDLVGKGPESDVVIDKIRERCEVVVMGNWDELILTPKFESTFKWHRDKLEKARIEYLKKLPLYYQFLMSGRVIRLSHAHPKNVYARVLFRDDIIKKLSMFEVLKDESEPDVAGYGDIHMTYIENIKDKIIFNTGSVGNPLDTNTASYAVLTGDLYNQTEKNFSIDIVRVPYDIELALYKAKILQMPELDEYAEELRNCTYRGRKKVF